jgi:tetratricopeptide (TPR) repeat protein
MRTFAVELAEETDSAEERASAITRLLDWYLHSCASASRTMAPTRPLDAMPDPLPGTTPLRFGSYRQALDWFDAERAGLVAAIRHAHATRRDQYCWSIGWVMMQYFLIRTHVDDWLGTQELGIASAQRLGNRLAVGIGQYGFGLAYYRLEDNASAIAHYDQALATFRELGLRRRVGSTQANRTGVLQHLQRYAESAMAGEQALSIAREVDAPELIPAVLFQLSVTYVRLGRDAEAVTAGEQALAMHRQMRDRDREALSLRALGTVYSELHRDADALAAFRRAARLHRELEVPYDEATVLVDLGDLCSRRGEQAEARHYWQQALALLVELRLPAADRVVTRLARSDADAALR